MAIKLNLGKLLLSVDFSVIFPGVLAANGFEVLPMAFFSLILKPWSRCPRITATHLTA
jgi:hypothetical protein